MDGPLNAPLLRTPPCGANKEKLNQCSHFCQAAAENHNIQEAIFEKHEFKLGLGRRTQGKATKLTRQNKFPQWLVFEVVNETE